MDIPTRDATPQDRLQKSSATCDTELSLEELLRDKKDKLGNKVQEFLWHGRDYIIYRTVKGIHVHFSNCANREKSQREAFSEICPELCELRFLTHEMKRRPDPWFAFWRDDRESTQAESSLFEHNMAQAIMLLMENESRGTGTVEQAVRAKAIAHAALEMAVVRCTNDNTIRYVRASVIAAIAAGALVGLIGLLATYYPTALPFEESIEFHLVAAFFGVVGAAFSVITRVRSFRMKPCQQSNMNYLMARMRIALGLIAGLMLYMIVGHEVGIGMLKPEFLKTWEAVAIIGFLGGFAERIVPTVFRRTAAALQEESGTPVQAVRKSESGAP